MSNHLLEKLGSRIDDIIETIEILRLQIEELEEKNDSLRAENTTLKGRQSQWEQGLTSLLNKLDDVSQSPSHSTSEEALLDPEMLEEMA